MVLFSYFFFKFKIKIAYKITTSNFAFILPYTYSSTMQKIVLSIIIKHTYTFESA